MSDIHPSLKALIPFATGIQATVGPYCEVALHDLKHPDRSLIHLIGSVTNRQLGAPVTDLVLYMLKKKQRRL